MTARRRPVRAAVTAAVAAVATVAGAAALAGCGSSPGPASATRHLRATVDYRPGLAARIYLPAGSPGAAPLAVLVPGGGWRTADETGLRPLADRLAGGGTVAVTITYRAADGGAHYPLPAEDVACGVSFAAQRARQAGFTPSSIVVIGHSAGAHLAALVALVPERFRDGCPYPAAAPTALVGISGPYELRRAADIALPFIGALPADAPAKWRAADPTTWVGQRRSLPVLLIHGTADTLVAPSFTRRFAEALRRAGHPVETHFVRGAGHGETYHADVAGPLIEAWLAHLPS